MPISRKPDRSPGVPSARMANRLLKKITNWFQESRRPLPWRNNRTSYAIWVSEVMLQQTVVSAVIPRFDRWMKEYPTIAALARADEREVLRAWEGLGYYSRARNLLASARLVARNHGGRLPRDHAGLISLPGIGDYTARAIRNIAYGEPVMAFDANIRRVLARYFLVRRRSAKSERAMMAVLERSMRRSGKTQLFEGLMELGEVICRSNDPRCGECPIAESCAARSAGLEGRIPPRIRRATTLRRANLAVFIAGSRIYIAPQDGSRNRGDSIFLKGLWGFPRYQAASSLSDDFGRSAARPVRVEPLPSRTHHYTRFRETLEPVMIRVNRPFSTRRLAGRWVEIREIGEYPFPSVERRIIEDLLARSVDSN